MHVAFVTGANRGIGLEFVKQLQNKGYRVIATSRSPLSECRQLQQIVNADDHIQIDLTDVDAISKLPALVTSKSVTAIDLLINNAGILIVDDIESANLGSSILEQFKVNSLAPVMVTQSLLSFFGKKAKVINITSRMGSIEDNTSGGYLGYRVSKTALNMATKCMALDLKKKDIQFLSLHPGYIRTGMTGGQGEMDPDEAVKRMIRVIDGLNESNSGSFIHRDGQVLPY